MDKSRLQLEARGQGWFGGMAAQKRTSILVSLALIPSIISLFLQAAGGSCKGRGVINPNYSASGPLASCPATGRSQLAALRLPCISFCFFMYMHTRIGDEFRMTIIFRSILQCVSCYMLGILTIYSFTFNKFISSNAFQLPQRHFL
jgi:hypothetical protein